jgi:hypothetical protein
MTQNLVFGPTMIAAIGATWIEPGIDAVTTSVNGLTT